MLGDMSETTGGGVVIADNPGASRYELRHDDQLVGWVMYQLNGSTITIPHVEVIASLRGRGHSGPFLAQVLADIEQRGLKVVPLCTYAYRFMHSRPEFADLLA